MTSLFVVDDSPALAESAATVTAVFPAMAKVLEGLPEGAPSLHAALVSAKAPSRDCLATGMRASMCGVSSGDDFLTTGYCGAGPNFAGSLADAFACMADFGITGCSVSQPFEAARRALGGALSGRTAFLGDDAYLVVVIVTGQDDASTREGLLVPPSEYVDFLHGLKPNNPDLVLVSVLGPASVCPAPLAAPTYPARLTGLLRGFGGTGLYYPLCGGNPAAALTQVAQRLGGLLGPACAAGIRDTDSTQQGLQPACTAALVLRASDGTEATSSLPSCANAPPPCWQLSPPMIFPNCPEWVIDVDFGPTCQPPSTTTLSCLGCSSPDDPACASPQ